jgi:hypothetical protein
MARYNVSVMIGVTADSEAEAEALVNAALETLYGTNDIDGHTPGDVFLVKDDPSWNAA